MKTSSECERARVQVMSWRDGEAESCEPGSAAHVSSCHACRRWLGQIESIDDRLGTLGYPTARADLWSPIESRIRAGGRQALPVERLWVMGAALVSLRALQLFVDLPLPWLHPIVAMAVAALAAWRFGHEFLTVETFAPELQKRGL